MFVIAGDADWGWTENGNKEATLTSDRLYVACAQAATNLFAVCSYTRGGTLVFAKQFTTSGYSYLHSIVPLTDGGIVVLATAFGTNTHTLVKLSATGSLVYAKQYVYPASHSGYVTVCPALNGGLYLASFPYGGGDTTSRVIRLSSTGSTELSVSGFDRGAPFGIQYFGAFGHPPIAPLADNGFLFYNLRFTSTGTLTEGLDVLPLYVSSTSPNHLVQPLNNVITVRNDNPTLYAPYFASINFETNSINWYHEFQISPENLWAQTPYRYTILPDGTYKHGSYGEDVVGAYSLTSQPFNPQLNLAASTYDPPPVDFMDAMPDYFTRVYVNDAHVFADSYEDYGLGHFVLCWVVDQSDIGSPWRHNLQDGYPLEDPSYDVTQSLVNVRRASFSASINTTPPAVTFYTYNYAGVSASNPLTAYTGSVSDLPVSTIPRMYPASRGDFFRGFVNTTET